jgi:hypothetical protein
MTAGRYLVTGASLLTLAIASLGNGTPALASYHRALLPLKALGHVGPYAPPYIAPARAKSGTWTDLGGTLPFKEGPETALLLTDGTVLVHDVCYGQWYKLTPDTKGKYETGTWSTPAAMPSGYGPLYFAAQVLPDGRVLMNGGEYNGPTGNCSGVETTKGALYDPVADSWTSVSAPSGWATIGDADSVILPSGSYMLANCCSSQEAIASISGTSVTWSTTGTSKADSNSEEGWTQLPGGDLLTVDANTHLSSTNQVELYNPSTGIWGISGTTAQELVDPSSHELGPAVLRPDGNLIYFGAEPHNDIYNVNNGTWTAGPSFDISGYDCEDAPAALLVSGNVVVQASPGTFQTPSHFWEFRLSTKTGAAKLVQVNDPTTAPNISSYYGRFLELPTGQVLWTNSGEFTGTNEVATYTPVGHPKVSWLPVVSSVSPRLRVGSKGNAISGTNFNGFSQGATYGDDAQMSTNYPLVRLTNNSTGDVCYARSYNFSTMGVWTTGTTNAVFDIPKNCETGASTLQVVVNGLASTGTSVKLK